MHRDQPKRLLYLTCTAALPLFFDASLFRLMPPPTPPLSVLQQRPSSYLWLLFVLISLLRCFSRPSKLNSISDFGPSESILRRHTVNGSWGHNYCSCSLSLFLSALSMALVFSNS
ncbi:hypothetical protein B0H15DRAFT_151576 [Mycena belliarum]|uniref:Uncharacterized protein n=1 Tax=Mycena belliarum TaxID=1033014 RepID=A0AAD6U959_9AGAR|nr:hypothetical protein B0H15DRAFT_151576 [Mycena belliae]